MSIKNIMLHADNSDAFGARLNYAIEFSLANNAHLTALYVVPRYAVPAYVGMPMDPGVIQQNNDYEWDEAKKLQQQFEKVIQASGCEYEWRIEEGEPVTLLNLHGRYFDLVILGQNDPDWNSGIQNNITDDLVVGLGRPCLVLPFEGVVFRQPKRILVAWNGSHTAARALNDAMPLLQAADVVEVITINPEKTSLEEGDLAPADICLHLARHGVKAVASGHHSKGVDKGALLLTQASQMAADLLVTGAYGHSRLREFILGGVTRHLLNNLSLPVFMSH